tara:strand:- start:1161 stop:1718 length:558 start_codon:yes stop_codon:yes gene_type:complete
VQDWQAHLKTIGLDGQVRALSKSTGRRSGETGCETETISSLAKVVPQAQRSLSAGPLSLQEFNWRANERVPAEVLKRIPARLREIDALLAPATPKELAVAVDSIFAFAAAFNIKAAPEVTEALTDIYLETLRDKPAWAIEKAIKRLKSGWKYQSHPKPLDLTESLPKEFHKLRIEQLRLEAMVNG